MMIVRVGNIRWASPEQAIRVACSILSELGIQNYLYKSWIMIAGDEYEPIVNYYEGLIVMKDRPRQLSHIT